LEIFSVADPDFDLLGDPIVEGQTRPGRPPHVVTDKKRNKVILLLAMGWSQKAICAALDCDGKTLRKHYSRELRARDAALLRVKGSHIAALWDAVAAGNVAAIKEMGRLIDRRDAALFGYGDAPADADEGEDKSARTPPMGKKEAANLAAQTAGHGSDWGNDLLPPTPSTQH
jgi:hypothetical protein